MPLELRRATIGDAEAWGAAATAALAGSIRGSFIWADVPEERRLEHQITAAKNKLSNPDERIECFKVVDVTPATSHTDDGQTGGLAGDHAPSEEAIAFGQWGFTRDAFHSEMSHTNRIPNPLPDEARKDFDAESLRRMIEIDKEFAPEGDHYVLMYLTTHPKHERRGAGSLILRHGVERADKDGLPIYLTASRLGAPLYRRKGWVTVAEMRLGLEEWGGVGEHVSEFMVRQPGVRPDAGGRV